MKQTDVKMTGKIATAEYRKRSHCLIGLLVAISVYLNDIIFLDYFYFQCTLRMPLQFIVNKKMEIVRGLLGKTNLPIKEIMTKVGFLDSTSFYRTFKKYAGLSPTEYRNKFFVEDNKMTVIKDEHKTEPK